MIQDIRTCGRYILEREIARGGMGVIWSARDPRLQRRVAIKLLAASSIANGALQRFQDEAKAAATLSHPNVVQVYDFGAEGRSPYIVMELLDGEDLDTRLRRVHKVPPTVAADILQQVARGLTAAHAAGFVHRDLKPANIFLTRGDAGDSIKVLDFGIAAARPGPEVTALPPSSSSGFIGTPAYMSPEQARSRPVDHRSDLWSAAVVAYQMLTGMTPFSATSVPDLIGAICSDPIPPPSARDPSLGHRFDPFFERAFSRDPAKRFQSATELAQAFAEHVKLDASKPAKILVVDDETDMKELFEQWFQPRIEAGELELLFAENGEQALTLLLAHSDIDVILSDIRMPRMDGLSLLAAVPDFAPTAKVVMVSAYGDMKNIRLAMNRGAFDFLFKPIDFDDLSVTVDKAIQQAEDARRVVRAAEENQLLRMFVHRGALDKALPLMRGVGAASSESISGTVALFDVFNSRQLLKDAPPDQVMAVLNAILELTVSEIAARSGVIERFVGDAALALFLGDDHEARAAHAAIAARDAIAARAARMGPSSPYAHGLTVGIESGTLVSGTIGSKSFFRLESVLLGQAVAVASRLENAAQKDEILIGPLAYAALATRFACEPRDVEGVDAAAHRLLHAYEHPLGPPLLKTTKSMSGGGTGDSGA